MRVAPPAPPSTCTDALKFKEEFEKYAKLNESLGAGQPAATPAPPAGEAGKGEAAKEAAAPAAAPAAAE